MFELIRDVTQKECTWLDRDFKKGEKVHKYTGCTYGCCSPFGSAFTLVKDKTPFFELPNDSVKVIL
jgi:hypothetical protein